MPPAATARDRPPRRDALGLDRWTLAAAALAMVHFGSFPLRQHPMVTDVRHFLYFAQQTAAGALPHLDFFDNKTQLATFTGAALYRLGAWVGVEPLVAIRGGYLALAALAATLAFMVHRQLGGGRVLCGVLALSFQCGFWLLGLMPCIGNVPKLWMPALAAATALCASRGAWLLAGATGALAALDWQVGALAVMGAVAAAWRGSPPERRAAAVGRVALGAALAAAPLLSLYGARGGLGVLYAQTIEASLFRAAASREHGGGSEWVRRWQVVATGCEGHLWLLAVAVVGVAVYVRWIRATAGGPAAGLVTVLAVYHYGLLAFSLWDFQVYGDLFAVLHTAAFFGAVATSEMYLRGLAWSRAPARRHWLPLAAVVTMSVAVTRPWVARGELRLVTGGGGTGVTLDDQRKVARRLHPLLVGRPAGVLGASEQLVLTGLRNPLPFVVWNPAVYSYYRQGPGEENFTTLQRLVDASDLQLIACDRAYPPCASLSAFELAETVAAGGYALDLYVRRAMPATSSPRIPAP